MKISKTYHVRRTGPGKKKIRRNPVDRYKKKRIRCWNCPYATFKRFGVYCEYQGVPITSDIDLKAYCPYERGGEFGK